MSNVLRSVTLEVPLKDQERDFDVAPEAELSTFFERDHFAMLKEPYERYQTNMREAGLPETTIARVGHALASYMDYLEQNDLTMYAQMLLPPVIDPHTAVPEGEEQTLIGIWEEAHVERNASRANMMTHFILTDDVGQIEIETGPMYSAKTDQLLAKIDSLEGKYPADKIHAFIAGVMDEDYIMSRRGGKGRSNPTESIRRLKADRVMYTDLVENLERIRDGITPEMTHPPIVVIDEISFIPKDEEQSEVLVKLMMEIQAKGGHIFATGLNTNYRGEELSFFTVAKKYMAANKGLTYNDAFYTYYDAQGAIAYAGEATHTLRIDSVSGFADLMLPVPIGRVHAKKVQYLSVPAWIHPFAVLKGYDPQALAELNAVREFFDFETEDGSENAQLFRHYERIAA